MSVSDLLLHLIDIPFPITAVSSVASFLISKGQRNSSLEANSIADRKSDQLLISTQSPSDVGKKSGQISACAFPTIRNKRNTAVPSKRPLVTAIVIVLSLLTS
jgi:hypothetical protein